MKIILETERLRMSEFTENDVDLIYELDSDPEVMTYINGGIANTREQAAATLKRVLKGYTDWKNLGIWKSELKDTNEYIGWHCLKPLYGFDEIEVGYRLLKRHWKKGYATEGAKALIQYGFNDLGLQKIAANINPANQASRHALQKSGLVYDRPAVFTSAVDGRVTDIELFFIHKSK